MKPILFVAKMFVPLASPGLASIGLGLASIGSSSYNTVQIISIGVGLVVIVAAGIFTIRSKVAQIWREQAEGEKARNDALVAEAKEEAKEHARVVAELKSQVEHLTAELTAANHRTDMTKVTAALEEITRRLPAPGGVV